MVASAFVRMVLEKFALDDSKSKTNGGEPGFTGNSTNRPSIDAEPADCTVFLEIGIDLECSIVISRIF